MRRKKRPKKKFYQINQYIKADQLRVVDEEAKQLGVLTKNQAVRKAQEAGSDLVLVAPNANPPVAKIIDFSKFRYQQKQKDMESRKKAKSVDIKEIRLTPFIAENDFNQRMKKAKKFLEGGDKVRLNVKFVGRQITRKDFGERVLNKALEQLEDLGTQEFAPRLQGKLYFTQLQPKKKK